MTTISDQTLAALAAEAEQADADAATWEHQAETHEQSAATSRGHAATARRRAQEYRQLQALATGQAYTPPPESRLGAQAPALRAGAHIAATAPEGLPAPVWGVSDLHADEPSLLVGTVYASTEVGAAQGLGMWAEALGGQVRSEPASEGLERWVLEVQQGDVLVRMYATQPQPHMYTQPAPGDVLAAEAPMTAPHAGER